jgi:HCOMODA/2-hydroxy-3-carboxy-muconic semialdehyde decarboxylase
MSDAVRDLCARIATANHILAGEGVVDAFGHISARHPEDPGRFLLSRSLSPAQVTPSDIMTFDAEGRVVGEDDRTPYLERFIHAAIYAARADVNAVVHNHAHDLIPFGVTGTPIRPLIHLAGAIGAVVPIWDIADRFGDTNLLVSDMAQARDLAEALGGNVAALMRGHGAVVTGGSVRNATLLSIYLQVNARLDLASRQLGEVRYLSDGEIQRAPEVLLIGPPAHRAWDYFAARWRSGPAD